MYALSTWNIFISKSIKCCSLNRCSKIHRYIDVTFMPPVTYKINFALFKYVNILPLNLSAEKNA